MYCLDPIDPAFHSPSRSQPSLSDNVSPATIPPASPVSLLVPETLTEDKENDAEEDLEQARRRTIAERMAKLGGIKFGAAPSVSRVAPNIAGAPSASSEQTEDIDEMDGENEDIILTEEEEERARKQRIAAKLAGMGGVGMFGAPQRVLLRPHLSKDETEEVMTPPPSQRAAPPSRPPPPPQYADIDPDRSATSLDSSEDAIKVEVEDNDPEKTNHEDAIDEEDAPPPPVPSRGGRRSSNVSSEMAASQRSKSAQSPPPVPGGRPPVPSLPSNVVNRRSSVRNSSADYAPSSARVGSLDISRAAPSALGVDPANSEYVMVDEPESMQEEAPPPPPSRPNRAPPSRPVLPTVESNASGWEIPMVPPTLSFEGHQLDLSLSSWTEDPTSNRVPPILGQLPASQAGQRLSTQAPQPPPEVQLTPDDLIAVWGRVGVQVCEAATLLFDKSKKSVIGDGSYSGFIRAVFEQVPNAMPPSSAGFGYLIYAQTASAVLRRASDIMPGDVVALHDAKLKGHKGLQMYHQNVGTGEPLLGIIGEFEVKKSKIKVFHANQHVGQQVHATKCSISKRQLIFVP